MYKILGWALEAEAINQSVWSKGYSWYNKELHKNIVMDGDMMIDIKKV